jgi:hypothetical protein
LSQTRSAAIDGSARVHEESGLKSRNSQPMLALEVLNVRTRPHRSRDRPRIGRRAALRATSLELELVQRSPQSQAPPPLPQARERAAGGPQDLAAYCCSCGYVFEAPVSTTVGCPHCGGTQAW